MPAPATAQGAASGTGYSLPEVLEAIQRARVTTRILYVTAHPDDESSSVLTYLARGLGADVALLSVTRGEGGQNALGPEQGAALGILRSEELLAATRAYGVRLYFTRAPDFGYSKTPEETLKMWGRVALDDMVQVIRSFRPHIVINHWGGVRSGHGQHQAAGLLTPQAVEAAADPDYVPYSIDRGLDTWKADAILQLARGDASGGVPLPADEISPLWGKSYAELGRDGFLNHRTQGIAAFLDSPFLRRRISLLRIDGAPLEASLLAQPLRALIARYPEHESRLRPVVDDCEMLLAKAESAAQTFNWAEASAALAAAGRRIGQVQPAWILGDDQAARGLAGELSRVAARIQRALALAAGVQVEAMADRNLAVAGERFGVRVEWRHRPGVPLEVQKPALQVPRGWSVTEERVDAGSVRFSVAVPPDAQEPRGMDGWMQPQPPSLVTATLRATLDGFFFQVSAPARAIRATSTRVENAPLALVPAVTLGVQPRRIFLRTRQPVTRLDLLVRVHYFGTDAVKLTAGIEGPAGWQVSPEQTLEFAASGDQLIRFSMAPPGGSGTLPAGAYEVKAYARRGDETFRTSVEPMPSLPTRLWREPAAAHLRVFDLAVPANLRVGYIAGVNDPIPEVLQQLGVEVELLDEVKLAFGDLSRFDAIAVGIRGYELRQDLPRANQRLLDYVAAGGTLVVQYQRNSDWQRWKPGPYPALMEERTLRNTDENSPARFLVPGHPALNFPNRITLDDFRGWVQERGLYFWSSWDSRYTPLLALRDPDEDEILGSLLVARHGKGSYIYTGLAFFRQLPEGVPGAFRLFLNLLSQSKKP